MTVNFIDVMDLHESVMCLAKLPSFKEIYLTGNPCENWPGCKDYVIAHILSLETYNGEVVTPSQRIKAQQMIPALKASLFEAIEKRKLELRQQEHDEK
jgi:protein TilB